MAGAMHLWLGQCIYGWRNAFMAGAIGPCGIRQKILKMASGCFFAFFDFDQFAVGPAIGLLDGFEMK